MVRNIVDDVAVNIQFDLYSPLIQSIVVLRLEKWMDSNLRYLMQCDPFYCKIPFDMMQGSLSRWMSDPPISDIDFKNEMAGLPLSYCL